MLIRIIYINISHSCSICLHSSTLNTYTDKICICTIRSILKCYIDRHASLSSSKWFPAWEYLHHEVFSCVAELFYCQGFFLPLCREAYSRTSKYMPGSWRFSQAWLLRRNMHMKIVLSDVVLPSYILCTEGFNCFVSFKWETKAFKKYWNNIIKGYN